MNQDSTNNIEMYEVLLLYILVYCLVTTKNKIWHNYEKKL